MNKLFSKLALASESEKLKEEILNLQKGELITTGKILIADNLMQLPSEPDGTFIWNLAIVYDDDDVAEIYPCAVEKIDNVFFAKFNNDMNGMRGVVSYISRVTA